MAPVMENAGDAGEDITNEPLHILLTFLIERLLNSEWNNCSQRAAT